ncbi:MAG: hypothetical protein ABI605_06720 [Rhizobacter sp.]
MSSEHYAINLAAQRPRASRWSWPLLALGIATACWCTHALLQARAAHEDATQTLQRLEAALAKRGAASSAAATRTPSVAERRLQADLARVSADLYRPWPALLDGLEASVVPKVVLQQLSVDSAFTKLQLQVDAPDLPELLQYVHALDTAGAPLLAAQLLGHEWQAGNAGPRRLQARISVALGAASLSSRALP